MSLESTPKQEKDGRAESNLEKITENFAFFPKSQTCRIKKLSESWVG